MVHAKKPCNRIKYYFYIVNADDQMIQDNSKYAHNSQENAILLQQYWSTYQTEVKVYTTTIFKHSYHYVILCNLRQGLLY